MLRSPHVRLVAAFDHRHVFVDPSPDPATSFAERQRLFALPGSSWADYAPERLSPGGGVYPRDAKTVAAFRRHARFPSEGAAIPPVLPGVSWSDHWAFWEAGYPALMVTDTAPYRYPWYHAPGDTPDRLDYDRLARVVVGLEGTLAELAQP